MLFVKITTFLVFASQCCYKMFLFFQKHLLKQILIVSDSITVGIRVFLASKYVFVKFWFRSRFRIFLSCRTLFPLSHSFSFLFLVFIKTKFFISTACIACKCVPLVTHFLLSVSYIFSGFEFVSHTFLFTKLRFSDGIFTSSFLEAFFSSKEAFS